MDIKIFTYGGLRGQAGGDIHSEKKIARKKTDETLNARLLILVDAILCTAIFF